MKNQTVTDIRSRLARNMIEPGYIEKEKVYERLECFNRNYVKVVKHREKTHRTLETAHMDTLRCLAAAAEYKDDDTGTHILRISRSATMIARAHGQNEEFCMLIKQASPMHDIGKIGIPDNVLKKPGKLTDGEWVVMRKHTEYGANILSGSDFPVLKMAKEVALTHHEKYDGNGYPFGLRGSNIPLSGRIVALADYFDALTMDRCYRPAFSDDKALTMVQENSGIHFDPNVVAAFFSISEKIIDSRDQLNREIK